MLISVLIQTKILYVQMTLANQSFPSNICYHGTSTVADNFFGKIQYTNLCVNCLVIWLVFFFSYHFNYFDLIYTCFLFVFCCLHFNYCSILQNQTITIYSVQAVSSRCSRSIPRFFRSYIAGSCCSEFLLSLNIFLILNMQKLSF